METSSTKAVKLVEEILAGQVEKLEEEDLSLLLEHRDNCVRKILPILAFEVTQIQEEEEFSPSRLQFSLQLASFFQESKAFDWICQLHPYEDVLQEALGDEFIPTHWAAILANTVHGELDRLKEEIENNEIDEEIRRACIEALTVLVAKNKLDRSKVVSYFQDLYKKILKGEIEETLFITGLVESSLDLWPGEFLEDIRELYGLGFIDEEYISLSVVLDSHTSGQEEALESLREWVSSCHPLDPLVPNTIFSQGELDELAEEFAQELSEASEEVDKRWQEEGFEEVVEEGEGSLVYFSLDSTEKGDSIEVPHLVEGIIPDPDIDSLSSKEKKRYFSLYEYSRTKPEKALEVVLELLEKHPDIPSFHNCLYDIYRVLDRRQEAIEVLKKIVERFPDYLLGKIEFASYLLRRGEPEKVAKLFSQAFTLTRLCPDRKFFYVVEWLRFIHVIGCYFVQVGMIDQAKQYLGVLQQNARNSEEYDDLKTRIHNELLLNSLDNELQSLE